MNARYKGDKSVMNDEQLRVCYDEFVDTAKLYESEQFSREVNIKYLTDRVNYIAYAIDLQRKFVEEFSIAFLQQLPDFEKFGHYLIWKNKEDFERRLVMVEQLEKPYISDLENAIKLNNDANQNKPVAEEKPLKEHRGGFIKTLNSLGKEGYRIDRDKSTMEDLAFMILQQFEEIKRTA